MKKLYFLAIILGCLTARAQFDTTGLNNWKLLTNSYSTWMEGAFDANRDTADPFDFGWGYYDLNSHIILGDSIYILKTINGNYKAISVDQIASGFYTVTFSDLDGSNMKTVTMDRTPYDTRNFFQYSLDSETIKDLEPASASWDIVFTKYLIYYPQLNLYYPVTGLLSNRNVEVAQVEFLSGGSYSLADTVNYPFSSDISTIGYDWKTAGISGTVIHDTLVYYVKDQNGNINELQMTGYGGSASGKMFFTVNGATDSVTLGSGNNNQVYYSLENQNTIATNQDNNWDIALFAQSSFSSIPVRINDVFGVELYVYPNTDISFWSTIGTEEAKDMASLISAYPNPARDKVNLVLHTGGSGLAAINILDQSGKVVRAETVEVLPGLYEYAINISGLPGGMYMMQISAPGIQGVHKLIIR